MLRCSAQEHLKVFVSVVFFNPAREFHHGFLIAFEDLQEAAILVEKYSRNANLGIGFAGLFQNGLKFGLGEEMRGGACANYMKHLIPDSPKSLLEKYGLRS
jgi:hypothetical protein